MFYDDANGDDVSDYVYIKSYSDFAGGRYVFATSDASYVTAGDNVVTLEGIYVDGVLTEVKTTESLATELKANMGKLYWATWDDVKTSDTYGQLTGINLVDEYMDYDGISLDKIFANYLEDTSELKLVGNTLYVNKDLSYNVTNANDVIYTDAAYEMSLADAIADGSYGIWVVGDQFNNTATVYVGTKLEQNNAINVTAAKDDTDKVEITAPDLEKDPSDNTWTVKIFDKNNDGTKNGEIDLSVIADGKYATIAITGDKGNVGTISGTTLKNVAAGDKYTVTVTTECAGQCSNKTWTIEVTGWDYISGAIDQVAYGGTENSLKKDVTVHYSYADAVTDPVDINTVGYDYIRFYGDNDKVVTNDDTTWPVKYMTFTNSDDAREWAGDFGTAGKNMTNATDDGAYYQLLDISKLTTGNVIVLRYTPQQEGGNYVYVAFEIQK